MQQEMKYGDFSVDDICRRTGTEENSKIRRKIRSNETCC
jgi:hypothetical protein